MKLIWDASFLYRKWCIIYYHFWVVCFFSFSFFFLSLFILDFAFCSSLSFSFFNVFILHLMLFSLLLYFRSLFSHSFWFSYAFASEKKKMKSVRFFFFSSLSFFSSIFDFFSEIYFGSRKTGQPCDSTGFFFVLNRSDRFLTFSVFRHISDRMTSLFTRVYVIITLQLLVFCMTTEATILKLRFIHWSNIKLRIGQKWNKNIKLRPLSSLAVTRSYN